MLPACLISLASLSGAMDTWQLDFGTAEPTDGFLLVTASERYHSARGYGYDLVGSPHDQGTVVTGTGGFYFSILAPPGNYLVSVQLGAPHFASDTTIKAESRRLMLDAIKVPAGESKTRSFVVNVRTPEIEPGDQVRLKDREKPYLHWDSKLTLEFNGQAPAIDSLEIRKAPEAQTIFLLGDSTVTDQPYEPWNSWGQMLPVFFDESVAVANHAESGETIRSSLAAGRFRQVEHFLKPGDYVFLQFGHNDMKDRSPDALDRYTTQLTQAVTRFRAHGAHPVLVTSMERKSGVKADTLGRYPDAVRQVSETTGAPLIDLHAMSRTLYQALGSQLEAAFQDGTHHNDYGSYLLAGCMAHGIQNELPELAQHFRHGIEPIDPAHPLLPADFHYPPSPLTDLAKPDGD
nr:rhamnogalacturonan acetylesterase [Haloferula luteola]